MAKAAPHHTAEPTAQFLAVTEGTSAQRRPRGGHRCRMGRPSGAGLRGDRLADHRDPHGRARRLAIRIRGRPPCHLSTRRPTSPDPDGRQRHGGCSSVARAGPGASGSHRGHRSCVIRRFSHSSEPGLVHVLLVRPSGRGRRMPAGCVCAIHPPAQSQHRRWSCTDFRDVA
jgi:hypothetical protein